MQAAPAVPHIRPDVSTSRRRRWVGRGAIGACRVAGALALFAVDGLSHLLRPPFYWRMFGRALLEIGYFSLPVVALTAIFTGMVLALQSYTGFARFSAESAVANVVVL